jgi:hypothetical protein
MACARLLIPAAWQPRGPSKLNLNYSVSHLLSPTIYYGTLSLESTPSLRFAAILRFFFLMRKLSIADSAGRQGLGDQK